jgi:hypothetical protein
MSDVLAHFLGYMDGLAATSPLLYWTLLGGLVVLALLLTTHVVVSLRSALAGSSVVERRDARADGAPSFAQEAERLAAEGRYLDAARKLQLACIETLLGRGVLELRRFEPNTTLRRRLDAAPIPPAQRREFAALLRRLETRLFRDRVEDRPLFEAWRELHRRLAAGEAGA